MKRLTVAVALFLVVALPLVALAADDEAGKTPEKPTGGGLPHEDRAMVAAFVACSVAFITAISILGAAYAVAHVGSAAIGAASEKPEMMGRSLIFVALGEGLAVLGLAVAFVLLFMVLTELVK